MSVKRVRQVHLAFLKPLEKYLNMDHNNCEVIRNLQSKSIYIFIQSHRFSWVIQGLDQWMMTSFQWLFQRMTSNLNFNIIYIQLLWYKFFVEHNNRVDFARFIYIEGLFPNFIQIS